MILHFFTGPHCELCDIADEILSQSQYYASLDIQKHNIRENTQHYHLYAVRIPVIKRDDTQAELGWPFTLQELEHFLA